MRTKGSLSAVGAQQISRLAKAFQVLQKSNFARPELIQNLNWHIANLGLASIECVLAQMAIMTESNRLGFYSWVESGLPYYFGTFGDMVRDIFDGNETAALRAKRISEEIVEFAPQMFPELRRNW